MNCLYFIVLPSLLFPLSQANAQTSSADQNNSYENIIAWYKNELAENSHLYTGKQYPAYRSGIQGTPFFLSPQMQTADIFYDGNLYKNIPLLYDLVRQEVVINRYDDNTRIKLLNEKIKYFTIAGHRFENIIVNGANNEGVISRFYDVVFEGKASVLISRIKRVEMTLDPQVPPKFTVRDIFFIRNGSKFFAVSKTSSVLKAFGDHKDQLTTFISENKLRFKRNIQEELVKTAAYYETLIK